MRKVLYASLLMNALLFAALFLKYRTVRAEYRQAEAAVTLQKQARRDMLNALPIDSSDIVFSGNSLTEHFPTEIFKAKNRGISGSTTAELLARLSSFASARRVMLMIGVNDLKNGVPVDTAFANFKRIADRLPSLVVQSTLPTANMEWNSLIIQYNDLVSTYCNQKGIPFVNLYPHFLKDGKLNEAYAYDGLHLNQHGYRLWLRLISPYVY